MAYHAHSRHRTFPDLWRLALQLNLCLDCKVTEKGVLCASLDTLELTVEEEEGLKLTEIYQTMPHNLWDEKCSPPTTSIKKMFKG